MRNCCLDDDAVCMGCFRTVEEICGWHSASDERKREIIACCETRRAEQASRRRPRGG